MKHSELRHQPRHVNPRIQDEEYRLRSVPEQPNDEAYQRDDEYNQQSR